MKDTNEEFVELFCGNGGFINLMESNIFHVKMLTRKEVADLHNVHVDTVTMWTEVGVLQGIKTGKSYMFSQEEIRRFQRDYRGLDVSNKVKALESYNKVNGDNKHIASTFLKPLTMERK